MRRRGVAFSGAGGSLAGVTAAALTAAGLCAVATAPLGAPAAGAAVSSTAPASGPVRTSASTLLAESRHDAQGASWVHEVSHGAAPGHLYSAVNDIGTFEGRQRIRKNGTRAEVVQIGQKAYIRGNATAVANFFGITKNDPQQLAGTWLSLVPSDGRAYREVIDAVTLKSDFSHQKIPGPLTTGHVVVVRGRRCIPIVGHVSSPQIGVANMTMYVTDSNTPLPVEFKVSDGELLSETVWSRWGHRPSLRSPVDAVPLSSLGG